MSQPDDQSPAHWSESPWVWFFMFAVVAVVALAVIGPKHVRRQQRLVRMQQARERVAASQAAGQQREAGRQQTNGARANGARANGAQNDVPQTDAQEADAPQQPVVSVLPLMAFLLLLVAAVGTGLMITARRRASRLAAAEKHPP